MLYTHLVRAHLTETIEYFKFGISIQIPKGRLVIVDESKGIALIGDDQVDILPQEYLEIVYN